MIKLKQLLNESESDRRPDGKPYKYKGDIEPATKEAKVEYDYDVIATFSDKEGDEKYDVVKYYFNIKEYNYAEDFRRRRNLGPYTTKNTPEVEGPIERLFDNRKRLLIKKLERQGAIPFKPRKLRGKYIIDDNPSGVSINDFIRSGEWKTKKEKEKQFAYDGRTDRRIRTKNMKLEVTYIVPSGYHFNVGKLYR
jgi:hypothetical protein